MAKNTSRFGFKIEILIVLFGILLTLLFEKVYGSIIKPIAFTVIILMLSMFYKLMFKTNKQNNNNRDKEALSIDELVEKINRILYKIKIESKDQTKFMVVSHFLGQINEFETAIPKLHDGYLRGKKIIAQRDGIINELRELQDKLTAADEGAKEAFQKAITTKNKTLEDIKIIKTNTEAMEGKLYYIYTILQNIETTIESSSIDDSLSDKDVTELNSQLEFFSDSVKDILSSIKI